MMPYEFDYLCVSMDDLRNNEDKSYKWLMDNSVRIRTDVKEILEEFYSKVVTLETMYDSNCNPEWGEASGNYRYRFMIVKTDDDYILVNFKVVDPKTAKIPNYFSVSYIPISFNGKSTGEVISALKEYPDIKSFVRFSDESSYYRNNYYNVPENFSDMDKGKWRSSHGVNKMSKIVTVNCSGELVLDIEEKVKEVAKIWNKFKGSNITCKSDLGLIKIAKRSNTSRVITFWYKDKLLGYAIGSVGLGKYIFIDVVKSVNKGPVEFLREYLEENDEDILSCIHKYLGSYIQYTLNKYAFVDEKFDALYYYSDMSSRKDNTSVHHDNRGLSKFKNVYFKNIIYYERVNSEDVIVGGEE